MSSIQDTVSLCPAASSSGQGLRRSLCVPVNFGDERLPERFWSKVSPCPMSGCWIWTGYQMPDGYGQFFVGGSVVLAHRHSYRVLVGDIDTGLVIDHRCRVPACCNPVHLEVVTNTVNVLRGFSPFAENARKTHCPVGHALSGDNLIMDDGSRRCRTCRQDYDRKRPRHKREGRRVKRVLTAEERHERYRAAVAKRLAAGVLADIEREIEEQ